MGSVDARVVFSVTSFLWRWLTVAYSAVQCPSATFLPSDVLKNFDDNTVTGQLGEQIASLKETVPALLQAHQVDVYAVAVVYRNITIFSTGMVDTPFRIGSVTKVFTAMGALMLRQQGRLELDDPVKKFLPKFSVINPYGKRRDITLRELMGHLSGLPRELCTGSISCGLKDEDETLQFIAKMQLVRPPWSMLPTYSNLGFAILGHAWEKATSPPQPWGEFVRNEISNPLKMHDTGLDFAHVKLAPGNVDIYDPSNTSIGWLGPAGDM
jgi:CubicO group peptidase (beta-lactamase class C family)